MLVDWDRPSMSLICLSNRELILDTRSFERDDLPEAGTPDIPTKNLSFGGTLKDNNHDIEHSGLEPTAAKV